MAEVAAELSIGQVAGRTGLSVHTLRFYERQGILATPVARGASGRRLYTEHDVEWLNFCTMLRASGMPLALIREYTDLVAAGPGNEDERLGLLRRHQESVTTQIHELGRCLDMITHKVGVYEDHLAQGTAGELWTMPPEPDCPSEDPSGKRAATG
jgi:DNA-binding transcriptional MerR regulator